eukprot:3212123-Rhodomonas_salina.1
MADSTSGSDEDSECQVCSVDLLKQTGSPAIFDCGEGHLLCQDCYETLEERPSPVCPACKIPLEKKRNRPLEKVRDKVLKKKGLVSDGTLGTSRPKSKVEQEKEPGKDLPPKDGVAKGHPPGGAQCEEKMEEKEAGVPEQSLSGPKSKVEQEKEPAAREDAGKDLPPEDVVGEGHAAGGAQYEEQGEEKEPDEPEQGLGGSKQKKKKKKKSKKVRKQIIRNV